MGNAPAGRFGRSLAAVIPAHNEEKTIGLVVRAVRAAGLFDEVVAVDDGSSDRTAEAARQAGADRVLELRPNRGKGEALAAGVAETGAELLCFLDADLLCLRTDHVQDLAAPVLAGHFDMAVGMWDRGPFWNRLARLLPLVSGQRVLKREVFEALPLSALAGYRCETALNRSCRCQGLEYGRVFLPGLKVRQKPSKVGLPRAVIGYFRMYSQVLHALLIGRLVGCRDLKRPDRV